MGTDLNFLLNPIILVAHCSWRTLSWVQVEQLRSLDQPPTLSLCCLPLQCNLDPECLCLLWAAALTRLILVWLHCTFMSVFVSVPCRSRYSENKDWGMLPSWIVFWNFPFLEFFAAVTVIIMWSSHSVSRECLTPRLLNSSHVWYLAFLGDGVSTACVFVLSFICF